ncbi:uncharacterized protein E5676_scaffold637G00660 [Cucumis melo var. makuwa]|uniref:Uncharacterized protein n=1 Tax=Cucumis melo var. makuwa TaxID=1194695 RepID=A0A5D3CWP1_CUCMM|nr:uncharacterized protein E5676_scaffold637G00660 [Cucumis melo var. makuwa]
MLELLDNCVERIGEANVVQVVTDRASANVMAVSGPLVQVLRLVDGEKKPPMGYIYEVMDRANETIAKSFNNNEEKYKDIFTRMDRKWELQLHCPLHAGGLTFSVSGCKRNWSVFEQVHSKKQNRLTQSRLNDLLFIKYNRALKHLYNLRDIVDPISLRDIDDSNEWLSGRFDDDSEEDELVFDNDTLTWGDVSRAVGVKEPTFYSRARASGAKTNVSCSSSSTTQPTPKQINLDDSD